MSDESRRPAALFEPGASAPPPATVRDATTEPASSEPPIRLNPGLGPDVSAGYFAEVSRPRHRPDPEYISHYRILERIGEGGMGVVYRAEQRQPVRRVVALKLIKLGMDSREVLARFEAERQALAMMNHPNVAKVFETGVAEDGRPFFAMEHVPGVPLTRYCDDNRLTTRQRLELFIPVCHAVQHAHQKGVIHRDLKPSNILVTLFDGKPVPKVIDFGIAKAMNQALTQLTLFTEVGSVIGTVEYMSPEQAMTSGLDVDTRTDVYSLGVILYELLTGTLPFDTETLRGGGLHAVARILRETDPRRPSTRVGGRPDGPHAGLDGKRAAETAWRHRTDPHSLRREIRGDLDWIVLKAMEKDRTRRYETANGLAMDVRRHLENEPVSARPPSTAYRLSKFARRYKAAVAAVGAVAAALVLGMIGTTIGLIRARSAEYLATRQKDELAHLLADVRNAQAAAERESQKASAASEVLTRIVGLPEVDFSPVGGPDAGFSDVLDWVASSLIEKLKKQPEIELELRDKLGRTYWNLGMDHEAAENARRGYALVEQTGATETETGLFLRLSIIDQGDDPAAKVGPTRAVAEKVRRLFGPDREVTVRAHNLLARVLRESGHVDDAEAVLRPVVEQCRRNRVPGSGQVAFQHLAQIRLERGDRVEAEALYREAVQASRQDRNGGRITLYMAGDLAWFLWDGNRHGEAADLIREALDDARSRIGDAHPTVMAYAGDYVEMLDHLGRRDEAARVRADFDGTCAALVRRPARSYSALQRRALANAHLGRLADAAADCKGCIDLDGTDVEAWFFRACLLARVDREGYRRHCDEMLRRFRSTNRCPVADRVAKTYLLVPRTPAECEAVAPLVEQDDHGAAWARPWNRMLRGMLAYRQSRFDDAIKTLNLAREDPPPDSPAALATIESLLAMSHQRLGHADQGRESLDRAARIIERQLPKPHAHLEAGTVENSLICHVIFGEAKELIQSQARPDGTPMATGTPR